MSDNPIGKVTHYFDRIGVAVEVVIAVGDIDLELIALELARVK